MSQESSETIEEAPHSDLTDEPKSTASHEDTSKLILEELDKIEPETETQQIVAEEPQPEPENKHSDYLVSFKKEEKELLKDLPEPAQKALAAREERYHSGLAQIKEKAGFADVFIKALQPHSQYLTAINANPSDYVPALVQTEMALRTGTTEQKEQVLQQLAHDYGVDLQGAAQLPFDPNLYQLQKQNEALNRKLQQSQTSQQDRELQDTQSMIGQWAQDKEHFDTVREDMAILLNAGKAEGLDDAYQKAIRLNDSLFSSFQAQQFEDRKKQEALKANEAAQKAKIANVQVKGAPTGGTSHPAPKNAQEAVELAMKIHGL